jgi:hypothetical protein
MGQHEPLQIKRSRTEPALALGVRAIARREQRMKKETASKGLFSPNVGTVTAFKKQEISGMRGGSRYFLNV